MSKRTPLHPSHKPHLVGPAGTRPTLWLLLLLGLPLVSCDSRQTKSADLGTFHVGEIANPAGTSAMAPSLSLTTGGVTLSWLEPSSEPADSESAEVATSPGSPGWALRYATLQDGQFGAPKTVVEGTNFFANWADFPSLVEHPSGALITHHLAKLGLGTYAYGAFLTARANPTGDWTALGLLHDDRSLTEHGFVSYAIDGDQLRAFWLDGREMSIDGPMTLRTTLIPSQRQVMAATSDIEMNQTTVAAPLPSEVLDDRVCECCQTDAATTNQGPVVVYRDRSEQEIRDIYLVRMTDNGWSEPSVVHNDNWEIRGCPVNGPAIAASGNWVAVAWFTGAQQNPRVQLALSRDAGRNFGPPILVQDGHSQGRVDLVVHPSEDATELDIWIVHLSQAETQSDSAEPPSEGMAILLDHLRATAKKTLRGERLVVAQSSEARASGFPRMVHNGMGLSITWVDAGDPSQVRFAQVLPQR